MTALQLPSSYKPYYNSLYRNLLGGLQKKSGGAGDRFVISLTDEHPNSILN